jgi:hypothetical protein
LLAAPPRSRVTAIVDDAYRSGIEASDSAIRRLSALAENEQWGAWFVAVVAMRVNALEPEIATISRAHKAKREEYLASGHEIRLNHYTSDDLLPDLLRFPNDRARRRSSRSTSARRRWDWSRSGLSEQGGNTSWQSSR